MTAEKTNDALCGLCGAKMALKQAVAAEAGSREHRFCQCEACSIGEWRTIEPDGGDSPGNARREPPSRADRGAGPVDQARIMII
jgi:hypothetical protein